MNTLDTNASPMPGAARGPAGIWLPLVTPFRDGALDERSLRRLVRHFAAEPVDGLILAATTGEGPTLDEAETERLVAIVAAERDAVRPGWPLWLGRSGSDTRRGVAALEGTAGWPVDGYLITCPSYNRPSQDGLFQHFAALADHTDRPILVYNIPYRTGVNMANGTLLALAGRPGRGGGRAFVGVKDCCADAAQSFDLTRSRPPGFSVLTGEDALFLGALTHGADGGILASAHVAPRAFAAVRAAVARGALTEALAAWQALVDLPRLLFAEPSPGPVKHWLWRLGLIDSPEVRLPMTGIMPGLAARLDAAIGRPPLRPADMRSDGMR